MAETEADRDNATQAHRESEAALQPFYSTPAARSSRGAPALMGARQPRCHNRPHCYTEESTRRATCQFNVNLGGTRDSSDGAMRILSEKAQHGQPGRAPR